MLLQITLDYYFKLDPIPIPHCRLCFNSIPITPIFNFAPSDPFSQDVTYIIIFNVDLLFQYIYDIFEGEYL